MEISAQEIIVLAELVGKKLATVEVVGELHADGNDERALQVTRPVHCQYTGQRTADCEYRLTFEGLRSIKTACQEQVDALTKTIAAIDSLMPAEKPVKKGKAA
jgi:hypothetical protein